jgi:hypothetical protein
MVKKLKNIFIDIIEEHLMYNKSWSIEKKQELQKRTMDFARKTDIVDMISFNLKELENYKTQKDISRDIVNELDKLLKIGNDVQKVRTEFASTSFMDRPMVEDLISFIQSDQDYPDQGKEILRNMLHNKFYANETQQLFEILGKLISEIRSEYPDISYPEWLINTIISYENPKTEIYKNV